MVMVIVVYVQVSVAQMAVSSVCGSTVCRLEAEFCMQLLAKFLVKKGALDGLRIGSISTNTEMPQGCGENQ